MLVNQWDIASAVRALPDEDYCGDMADFWWEEKNLFLALADGLGHGFEAYRAAQEGICCLRVNSGSLSLIDRAAGCDKTLRMTRGIALGLALITPEHEQATFIGIGNIRAIVLSQRGRRWLVCGNGIVGGGFDSPFIEQLSYIPGDMLILASDGIAEDFNRELNLELNSQTQTQMILNRYALAHDDASVLVARWIDNHVQSISEKTK